MKRLLLLYAGVFTMLFIGGCNTDESVTTMDEERNVDGRVIGMVHGVVTDNANNAQLPGVVVTTAVNGQIVTTTTNSRGYYALTNLPSGEYVMTFDFPESAGKAIADAYAVGRVYQEIPTLEDIGIVDEPNSRDFPYSLTCDMYLYPLTAATAGKVFKSPDAEHANPAGAVTVIADFGDYDLLEDEYTATTDAEGNYAFASLPATYDVTIRTLPFDDGEHNFGSNSVDVELVAGAAVAADNIVVGIAGVTPIVVVNNFETDHFGLAENLELTFSEPMQTATFEAELWNYDSDTFVPAAITWTDDLNLVINPYALLQPSVEYVLVLEGRSQQLVYFEDYLYFYTIPGIELDHMNLELVEGEFTNFSVDGNIEATYTEAVDLTHLGTNINLFLTDLAGDPPVAISTSLSTDNKTVIIDPVHRLEPGTHYELRLVVYGAGNLGMTDNSFNFYTAYDTTMPVVVTGFALDMGALWTADWNTTAMTFRWTTQPGVTGYRIYARDTEAKSDFVRVLTVAANGGVSYQTGAVNLGTAPFNTIFDVYAGDGQQTPFTAGRDVVFEVAAYNGAGQGAFSTPVTVSDLTAPTGSFWAQVGGSANNTTDAVRTITVAFHGGVSDGAAEYLDASNPPEFSVVNGGVAYVLPASQISFAWDADARGGVITLRIPATSNAVGDQVLVSGFSDSSLNPVVVIPTFTLN